MQAWHYTTGIHFERIVASGVLMPARSGVAPPEKPILWFSLEPYWEPTACKGWQEPGSPMRVLTMLETFERCRGLVRFGCPLRLLRSGEALRREARMKSAVWIGLAQAGKSQGAKPGNWWGTTREVQIDRLATEAMTQDMRWEAVRSLPL